MDLDGKVVVIEDTIEHEFYKDKRKQISIFMSPLNVHNNLYPISGKIMYTKYHPGKFLFAWNPKASEDNERSTIVIENHKNIFLCAFRNMYTYIWQFGSYLNIFQSFRNFSH